MAKKDMRREDLVIPYQEPATKEGSSDFSSAMGSTLPMAAMFTRNKYIGWTAVIFAIQGWLSESSDMRKTASQPAYFTVVMSLMALAITYIPLFMPPPPVPGASRAATGTEAAPAAPPA